MFDEPIAPDNLWFLAENAPGLAPGDIANFWIGITVPDDIDGVLDGQAVFTLRQLGSVAAVPEPASIAIWSLIGLCFAGFGYYRTRRKK